MGAAQTELDQCMQKRERFPASLICYHARLVKVKNVSVGVSERQALSNLIRLSRSRDPIMKYDSLSTLMSPVDVSVWGLRRCPALSHHQWLGVGGKTVLNVCLVV